MSLGIPCDTPAPRRGAVARLRPFAASVFEPRLHLLFASSWSLSLFGALHVVSGTRAIHARASLVVLVLTVFLCLFFLRVVDEVKDYRYDVVHNPDRPLVTGLVTRQDLARYLTFLAVAIAAMNAALPWPDAGALLAWLALDLLYGLFHIPLERWSRTVRESLPLNLVAVYPVNVGLSVYTLLFFGMESGSPFEARQAWLVVAYACAFLHFELARKSGWPHLTDPSERLYSHSMGMRGALAAATAFGAAAIGLAVWLFAPWSASGAAALTGCLPLLALVPMGTGLALFARRRHRRHAARPPAVAFLFTFYPTILLHTLVAQPLVWGR